MNTLFPVEPAWPEGFNYNPEFITGEEEKQLLATLSGINLEAFLFQGFEAKRKVASFGYDYSFESRRLNKGKDIPVEFNWIMDRTAGLLGLQREELAELLITEYPAGSVINWHRDAPPFDLIAGISLLADCTFRLRPYDPHLQNRKSIISIPVQRRSLYVLRGPARNDWQHSITAVPSTRFSITLRTLKRTGP